MAEKSKVVKISKWFGLAGVVVSLLTPVLMHRDIFPHRYKEIEIEENYNIVDKNNLIQKIIGLDESLGVYSQEDVKKARALADKWIQHASSLYSPPDVLNPSTMREYLRQINDDLRSHFYYDNDSAIASLNNHFADCDLYSYLLIDVAKKHGIELKMIFSPSHAFLVWENPNGIDLLWESTASKPVNLGNDSFYKLSNSPSDYRPLEEPDIFDQIILDYVGDRQDDFAEQDLKRLALERAELALSPFSKFRWLVLAKELGLDNSITFSDKYEPLLKQVYQNHPSFLFPSQYLAKYYYNKGDHALAATYINNTLSFPKVSPSDLMLFIAISDKMFLDKFGVLIMASALYLFETLSGEVPALKDLLIWFLYSVFVTAMFACIPHIVAKKTTPPDSEPQKVQA